MGGLLDRLGPAPVVHFGDLDPNGVKIYRHLRERYPDLKWFLPSFWSERLAGALPATWPPELTLDDLPTLVRDLAVQGCWLEQEPIVLDPRIATALEQML